MKTSHLGAEPLGRQYSNCITRLGRWLSCRAVSKILPRRNEPLDMLDIGCGYDAKLLFALGERLHRREGIDVLVDPVLKTVPDTCFHEGNLYKILPELENTYDVISMIHVLEHLDDPLTPLVHAKNLLKPHGRLIVNVPTWRGKKFYEFMVKLNFMDESSRKSLDEHQTYYTLETLWPLLVKAGFRGSGIKLWTYKGGFNLLGFAQNEPLDQKP